MQRPRGTRREPIEQQLLFVHGQARLHVIHTAAQPGCGEWPHFPGEETLPRKHQGNGQGLTAGGGHSRVPLTVRRCMEQGEQVSRNTPAEYAGLGAELRQKAVGSHRWLLSWERSDSGPVLGSPGAALGHLFPPPPPPPSASLSPIISRPHRETTCDRGECKNIYVTEKQQRLTEHSYK